MTAATDLLEPCEAARRMHVSERTLRDLKRRGLIRYVAVTERKIRYRPEDCEEYLSSRVRQDEPRQPARGGRKNRPVVKRRGNVVPFTKQVGI